MRDCNAPKPETSSYLVSLPSGPRIVILPPSNATREIEKFFTPTWFDAEGRSIFPSALYKTRKSGFTNTISSASNLPRSNALSESAPRICAARNPLPPPASPMATSCSAKAGSGRSVASIGPLIVTGAFTSALERASNSARHAFQSTNKGAASAATIAAINRSPMPKRVCCNEYSRKHPRRAMTQNRTQAF